MLDHGDSICFVRLRAASWTASEIVAASRKSRAAVAAACRRTRRRAEELAIFPDVCSFDSMARPLFEAR